ncbi:MAG TPA: pectinesterase family protein [Lacunisphaera sp.]|nr:pectinesterase family protein [Lacunisphaera sp.]
MKQALHSILRAVVAPFVFMITLALAPASPALFPAPGSTDVNPDTRFVLTFSAPPSIGESGLIRIYDAEGMQLVDTLDLSIPSSPNPSGRFPTRAAGVATAPRVTIDPTVVYQKTAFDGVEFFFRPIIVRGNVATIHPHNGALKYGRTYVVKLEASVLVPAEGDFAGYAGDTDWTFTTKAAPPPADTTRVVVAADGSGDFNTVQAAIEFFPRKPARRATVFIRSGHYEELVSLSSRSNLTIRGEDRDQVQVGYANNSAFQPGRRWAFSLLDCADIQLSNFTINNYFIGQAEALMVRGERIVIDHMTLNGSGDAFTPYGTVYFADSLLTGHGDTVLGYAAVYFFRSEIRSYGPFTWTRTPKGSHGNVFVDCTLVGINEPLPWTVTATDPGRTVKAPFARLPRNGSPTATAANFPYAEMVLINTRTSGVPPEGWGPIEEAPGFDRSNVRFWEYNTMDLEGRPVDVSQRHPVSRQLTMEKDAETIANYRDPAFVLGGWSPVVEP